MYGARCNVFIKEMITNNFHLFTLMTQRKKSRLNVKPARFGLDTRKNLIKGTGKL